MVRISLVHEGKGDEVMWVRVDLWSTKGRGKRVMLPADGYRKHHAAVLGLLSMVIDPALGSGKYWDLRDGEELVDAGEVVPEKKP